MSAVEFRYNIDTQTELYRQETQPLGRLPEASCKTFVLTKDNKMKTLKHGGYGTRLYSIWQNMKKRCANKNNKYYADISVCNEWLSFPPFRDWANVNGYTDELSIDRIDGQGNYEPSNCRWACKKTQARNTKKLCSNNTSGLRGVVISGNKQRWKAQISVNDKVKYIGTYDTKEEAGIAYDNFVLDNKLEHTLNFERST